MGVNPFLAVVLSRTFSKPTVCPFRVIVVPNVFLAVVPSSPGFHPMVHVGAKTFEAVQPIDVGWIQHWGLPSQEGVLEGGRKQGLFWVLLARP